MWASAEVSGRAPWAPVCLLLPSTIQPTAAMLSGVRALNGSVAYHRLSATSEAFPASVEAVLAAVRARGNPGPEAIARYVGNRVNWDASDTRTLLQCLAAQQGGGELAPHRGTLWRRLNRLGQLAPSDWRALALILSRSASGRASNERNAVLVNWDTETWRRRVAHLLGPLAAHYQTWPGWEWPLEAALRRWGYVADAYPDEAGATLRAVGSTVRASPRPKRRGRYG